MVCLVRERRMRGRREVVHVSGKAGVEGLWGCMVEGVSEMEKLKRQKGVCHVP